MSNIEWSSIVGQKTLEDGGYAGDLLALAMVHLARARDNSQLTDELVGEVYAGTINAAFQNGIGFAMQEELTEAKVELTLSQKLQTDRRAI